MADKITNGMCLACARGPLYQNSAMLFQLLGDSNLLGICRLAEKHLRLRLTKSARRKSRFFCRSTVNENRGFFSDDVQQRPGQIGASAQVFEDAFNSRGKTQRARAQKYDRIAADARLAPFTPGHTLLDEFAARRELHDQTLQKAGSRFAGQRMIAFLLQFFTAASDGAPIHVA